MSPRNTGHGSSRTTGMFIQQRTRCGAFGQPMSQRTLRIAVALLAVVYAAGLGAVLLLIGTKP